VTPAVRLRLHHARTPFFGVYPSIGGPYAVVERPLHARGPVYVRDSTYCGLYTGLATVTSDLLWHPIRGDRITSGCLGPQQWHGYMGYLNFPVGTIDYTTR
jgi:hypothetical protein